MENLSLELKNEFKSIDLLAYVDFEKICDDFQLHSGDFSPSKIEELRGLLSYFIYDNSVFKLHHIIENSIYKKPTNQ